MKYTQTTFVAKATSIFDKLYDYSKFEFINMQTKGLVICNTCNNEWLVRPSHHISYQTHCPKCIKKSKQMTIESFKAKAYELFKHQYDYSDVIELPNGALSKISIRCVKHNSIFKQSIRYHLDSKVGCKDCLSIKLNKTKEECIEELKLKPNFEMINFNKFEYKGDREFITITCNICNTDKTILYTSLKTEGFKCTCSNTKLEQGKESFIIKAKDYLDKYTILNLEEYNGYLKPLQFKCNEHSIGFKQTPNSIIRGYIGCDVCSNKSKGFSRTKFIEKCVNNIGHIYLIKLKHKDENEFFYKIGITSSSVKERYKNLNKNYNYSIIIDLKIDATLAYNIELKIKHILKAKQYLISTKNKFYGSQLECFKKEGLQEILDILTDVA